MSNDEDLIDAQALATVGPERLATLLVEAALRNSSMQRRLQFELIAHKGQDVAAGVRQWISELVEQSVFLDARLIGELADELDALRIAIASEVRRVAPTLAPDLMWQIFSLAGPIFERTIEEGWEVSCVFERACSDLVKVSVNAGVDSATFAKQVVAAILSDGYGEYGALIRAIASAQPCVPAYVSELSVLLQQLLDESPAAHGSLTSEHSRVLQRALRELNSPTAA